MTDTSKTPAPLNALNTLKLCRDRFAEYVVLHSAKQTMSGNAKARRHQEMVDLIDDTLAEESLKQAVNAVGEPQEPPNWTTNKTGTWCNDCGAHMKGPAPAIRTALETDK